MPQYPLIANFFVHYMICHSRLYLHLNRLRAAREPGSTGRSTLRPCRTTPCIVNRTPTRVHHPPTIVAVTVAVTITFYTIIILIECQEGQLFAGIKHSCCSRVIIHKDTPTALCTYDTSNHSRPSRRAAIPAFPFTPSSSSRVENRRSRVS